MRRIALTALATVAVVLAAAPRAASGWERSRAGRFAALPEGAPGPEGLEVDPAGNVYVGSFGFTPAGPVTGEGLIWVFDRHGDLQRTLTVQGSSAHLLGLHWRASTGKLLVVDNGAHQVLEVDPSSGSAQVFFTAPENAGLNDVTEDRAGNVYVSDSFQGIIWRTGPSGVAPVAWASSDTLLKPHGVPPFGANGLRFNRAETALFVANTADDRIVKIPVAGGVAGAPEVFTNGINGADGLVLDEDDNLWVAANQADEIVVVDPTGRAIAKLGDFDGVKKGSPRGLLFPASLRFAGGAVLVTNLALDLRLFDPTFVSVDSAWCALVTRPTVARIRAELPRPAGHEER